MKILQTIRHKNLYSTMLTIVGTKTIKIPTSMQVLWPGFMCKGDLVHSFSKPTERLFISIKLILYLQR